MAGICAIVLAAGAGRRFGGAVKQLAPLGDRPLVRWAVEAAADARHPSLVVVVLGAHADAVEPALAGAGARVVRCTDWEAGLSASLRAGLDAAGDAEWALVTLGDAPLVRTAAIDRVALTARAAPPEVAAVRARWDGVPGHPVALRRTSWPALRALQGDEGARSVLAGAVVLEVDCDGLGDPRDADTPDALDELRAALHVR